MPVALGKSPIETLKNFRARKWFDKEFKKFALRIATEYSSRNEVFSGCVISKGGGTSDAATSASRLNLSVSSGWLKLNGVLMGIGALTDKEAADASAAGAVSISQSTCQFALGGVPTLTANSGASEKLTIASGSLSAIIRFYDPGAGGEFDLTNSSDYVAQIDISLDGLNNTAVALAMETGLKTVFTTDLGYSYTTGATFVMTAPAGSGFDITFTEEGTIGSITETITNYTYSYGGMITAAGAADTAAHNAAAASAYYINVIASNSNGTGGANSDDGDTALIHCISSTSAYLQTNEINAALDASSGNVGNYDHSGVTGWVHLARISWGSSDAVVTGNRNNAVAGV